MRIHSDPTAAGIVTVKTRAQVLQQEQAGLTPQKAPIPATRGADSVSFSVLSRAEAAGKVAQRAPASAIDAKADPILHPPTTKLDPQFQTEAAEAAPRVYGEKDLAAIQAAWGATRGDRSYSALADANNDGVVNFDDHNFVLARWGQPVENPEAQEGSDLTGPFGQVHLDAVKERFGAKLGESRYAADADPNGDGVIDFNDITYIISNWGQPRSSGNTST